MRNAQQVNDNKNQNQRKTVSMQAAYDISYHVHNFVGEARKKTMLKSAFFMAAAIGSSFFLSNPIIPIVIINAAIVYETLNKRGALIKLADIFYDSIEDIDLAERHHLEGISDQLKDVEELGIKDINPIRHFNNGNYFGISLVALSVLFAPYMLASALGIMAANTDNKKGINIEEAAKKAAKNMKRINPALQN